MKYFVYFFIFLSSLHGDEFEEGAKLIKQKEYVQAVQHFKRAAKSGSSAAVFGKAICEVALGKSDKAAKHLQQIHQLACSKCEQESAAPPVAATKTARDQVLSYECRQRVRKVTQELRTLVETMVADTVPGFLEKIRTFRQLNPYIDMLERDGLACCQKKQTAESCTEPLVEQLKLWNSEGLSVEPEQGSQEK
jgi:hypothetical protein